MSDICTHSQKMCNMFSTIFCSALVIVNLARDSRVEVFVDAHRAHRASEQ